MKLEVNDQEATLILNALGELPAKVSYQLLGKLSGQIAIENQRRHPPSPLDAALPQSQPAE